MQTVSFTTKPKKISH